MDSECIYVALFHMHYLAGLEKLSFFYKKVNNLLSYLVLILPLILFFESLHKVMLVAGLLNIDGAR